MRRCARAAAAAAALWTIAASSGPAAATTAAGAPNLAMLRALVQAGGGVGHFKTTDFVAALDSARADAEFAALVKRHGAARVKGFVTVFDFVINDGLRRLRQRGIALPAVSEPDPTDGSALTAALAAAGKSDGDAAVSTSATFDRLLTPAIRTVVFNDAADALGSGAVKTFDALFSETFDDLATAP